MKHEKIVELLSKLTIHSYEEYHFLLQEIKSLKDKNRRLEQFLLSLKDEPVKIEFFNFNDYTEESVIGEGSTSNVHLVTKKAKYAWKELKDFTYKSMQRFLSEGEILFRLRHPCIIRIHGFNYGDEEHAPSIILSLEPTSLEAAISEGSLNEMQRNRIAVEIVLGMRYIHFRGFMHRDLKPSNILLSKNTHARISDFGLAKEDDMELSQSKGIGSLCFMAPELFEENDDTTRYTNKVDVYSFGVILIYILTGSYPKFSMRNMINRKLPSLPTTIVRWAKDLINRCLSHSEENRPSFAEIFEIMKENNYDLFCENSHEKLTRKKQLQKDEIEARVIKIEAFEYQHKE